MIKILSQNGFHVDFNCSLITCVKTFVYIHVNIETFYSFYLTLYLNHIYWLIIQNGRLFLPTNKCPVSQMRAMKMFGISIKVPFHLKLVVKYLTNCVTSCDRNPNSFWYTTHSVRWSMGILATILRSLLNWMDSFRMCVGSLELDASSLITGTVIFKCANRHRPIFLSTVNNR